MRRRLYFVLPDLRSADTIQRELLLARIEAGHIHFLARDGVNLGQLSVANLLQRSELVVSQRLRWSEVQGSSPISVARNGPLASG